MRAFGGCTLAPRPAPQRVLACVTRVFAPQHLPRCHACAAGRVDAASAAPLAECARSSQACDWPVRACVATSPLAMSAPAPCSTHLIVMAAAPSPPPPEPARASAALPAMCAEVSMLLRPDVGATEAVRRNSAWRRSFVGALTRFSQHAAPVGGGGDCGRHASAAGRACSHARHGALPAFRLALRMPAAPRLKTLATHR